MSLSEPHIVNFILIRIPNNMCFSMMFQSKKLHKLVSLSVVKFLIGIRFFGSQYFCVDSPSSAILELSKTYKSTFLPCKTSHVQFTIQLASGKLLIWGHFCEPHPQQPQCSFYKEWDNVWNSCVVSRLRSFTCVGPSWQVLDMRTSVGGADFSEGWNKFYISWSSLINPLSYTDYSYY